MQIVLLLIVILLILLVVAAKKDSMSNRTKVIVVVTSALVLMAIYAYETVIGKNNEKIRVVVNAYYQGKTLVCDGYDVDSNKFLYVNGTQTFSAKKDQKELSGVTLQASSCSIKE